MVQYNRLRSRLYISCEFIDFLLFFYQFIEVIDSNRTSISAIKEWCETNKVSYVGMLKVIEARDNIIKEMTYNAGMDVFAHSDKNIIEMIKIDKMNDIVPEIIKIKKCIFDGYRLNLAVLDDENNVYITSSTNIPVNINSYITKNLPTLKHGRKFVQTRPKYVVYSDLTISYNSMAKAFEFNTGACLSVMDGFVDIDMDMMVN